MKNIPHSLWIALTLSLTTLVASATPPNTGIEGRTFVYFGPIGPPIGPVVPAVVWALPVATTFTVLSYHSGKVVARGSTDSNGDFALPLNPGRYIIVPAPLVTTQFCFYQTPHPFEVTVRPHVISYAGFTYVGNCHGIITPHDQSVEASR